MATAQLAQKRPPKHRYSATECARALTLLDANGGNVDYTARELGIHRQSLIRLVQRAKQNTDFAAEVHRLRQETRGDLAESAVNRAWRALTAVDEGIMEASARDAAVVFGIMVDKAQLLRGLPTAITAQADPRLARLTDEQFDQLGRWLEDAERGEALTNADMKELSPVPVSQTVEADAQRARDGGRGGEPRVVAGAVQQPGDGRLGQAGAAGELAGADALVGEHGAEARGEPGGG